MKALKIALIALVTVFTFSAAQAQVHVVAERRVLIGSGRQLVACSANYWRLDDPSIHGLTQRRVAHNVLK